MIRRILVSLTLVATLSTSAHAVRPLDEGIKAALAPWRDKVQADWQALSKAKRAGDKALVRARREALLADLKAFRARRLELQRSDGRP